MYDKIKVLENNNKSNQVFKPIKRVGVDTDEEEEIPKPMPKSGAKKIIQNLQIESDDESEDD